MYVVTWWHFRERKARHFDDPNNALGFLMYLNKLNMRMQYRSLVPIRVISEQEYEELQRVPLVARPL